VELWSYPASAKTPALLLIMMITVIIIISSSSDDNRHHCASNVAERSFGLMQAL
jgi:hypothetical protein